MAEVSLVSLTKRYEDGTEAVDELDLEIADGEFLVMVGPSGCGKSSTLRMVAGLEEVTSGDVLIGGERVNHVSPAKRNIAMVFQNYALYPHMTVRKNMELSLKLRHVPKAQRRKDVEDTAEILGLSEVLHRRPAQLSGGQRQRVAMGRAIVRQPTVFLLDEPLSNLDAKLRTQMRTEIRELQQRFSTTTLFVTHDQVEAMTMADRIAILRRGVLQQAGLPRDLYRRPANLFVADFIGSPPINLLRGRLFDSGDAYVLRYGNELELRLATDDIASAAGTPPPGGVEVIFGIRPEHLRLGPPGSAPEGIPGIVRMTEELGDEYLIHLEVPAPTVVTDELRDVAKDVDETVLRELEEAQRCRFVIRAFGESNIRVNDAVTIEIVPGGPLYLFDPARPGTPAWAAEMEAVR